MMTSTSNTGEPGRGSRVRATLAPAPVVEGALRRDGRRQHGKHRSFLGPAGEDEVVQSLTDALPPP